MLNVVDRRSIEARSRMLLEKYCPDNLRDHSAIPIEHLVEKLGLDIEYQYLTKLGEDVLGKLVCTDGLTPYYDMDERKYMLLQVKANTIIIEVRLADKPDKGRYRFTVAHELAHWLLHKSKIIESEAALTESGNSEMERQADYMASALLMPINSVKGHFYKLQGKCGGRENYITAMAEHFCVSRQAMQIRLENHNLI